MFKKNKKHKTSLSDTPVKTNETPYAIMQDDTVHWQIILEKSLFNN